MPQLTSKLILSADGTRIYINAVGEAANPALIFVHGFSTDSAIFDDLFKNADYSQDFFLVISFAYCIQLFNTNAGSL
jgi:pimeloyl-ACP methyl ester carboxylesterase